MKPRKFPELNVNEIHIWSTCLLKNNVDYFYSVLSEDECERASSFKFFKDQRRFIITRGILRCLLSHYLGQTPESIEFVYGLWGKPYLSGDSPLCFNVSHSADYALYAMTHSCEVGIDLEYINKSLELENMAFHIFSAAELVDWKNLDLQERVNAFFMRWVSREAFLKAFGRGWLEDKKELTFNAKVGSEEENLNDEAMNLYCFECIPGYASALFVKGRSLQPFHYYWD